MKGFLSIILLRKKNREKREKNREHRKNKSAKKPKTLYQFIEKWITAQK